MMDLIFDRDKYLELSDQFEGYGIDYADNELSEFNFEITDIAFELANTRYALAKAEQERDQCKAESEHLKKVIKAADNDIKALRAQIKEAKEPVGVITRIEYNDNAVGKVVVRWDIEKDPCLGDKIYSEPSTKIDDGDLINMSFSYQLLFTDPETGEELRPKGEISHEDGKNILLTTNKDGTRNWKYSIKIEEI